MRLNGVVFLFAPSTATKGFASVAAEKAPMKSESLSQIVSFVAVCGASPVPGTPSFFEFDAGEMLEQKESS
jgi:hypothetical protein